MLPSRVSFAVTLIVAVTLTLDSYSLISGKLGKRYLFRKSSEVGTKIRVCETTKFLEDSCWELWFMMLEGLRIVMKEGLFQI